MNRLPQHPINDELLSAYIDGDVSEEERQLVETAIENDAEVAWQVETLRQTVQMLQELPSVQLPRSFVLSEEEVSDALESRQSTSTTYDSTSSSWWQQALRFFNSGNIALRNASAVAAVLFIVLVVGQPYLTEQPGRVESGLPAAEPESAVMLSPDATSDSAPDSASDAESNQAAEEPSEPEIQAFSLDQSTETPDTESGEIAGFAAGSTPEEAPTGTEPLAIQPTPEPDAVQPAERMMTTTEDGPSIQSSGAETAPRAADRTTDAASDDTTADTAGIEDSEGDVESEEAATLADGSDEDAAPETMAEAAPAAAAAMSAEEPSENVPASPETAAITAAGAEEEVETEAEVEEEVRPPDDTEEITIAEAPESAIAENVEPAEPEAEEPERPVIEEQAEEESVAEQPSLGVWRIMQISTLLLSLILMGLWAASRRVRT